MPILFFSFFFFNDTATTEIYTLSLHDALPISRSKSAWRANASSMWSKKPMPVLTCARPRSEEHTSELQSLAYLVCRLLLEKKKKKHTSDTNHQTQLQTYNDLVRHRLQLVYTLR